MAYENKVRKVFAEIENSLDTIVRLREQFAQKDDRRATTAEDAAPRLQPLPQRIFSPTSRLDAQRRLNVADIARPQLCTRLLNDSMELHRGMAGDEPRR